MPASFKKQNRFLDHDSYISCNRIFEFDDYALKNSKCVGHLGYQDLLALRNHIKNNVKTLPKADKELILAALDEEIMEQA